MMLISIDKENVTRSFQRKTRKRITSVKIPMAAHAKELIILAVRVLSSSSKIGGASMRCKRLSIVLIIIYQSIYCGYDPF